MFQVKGGVADVDGRLLQGDQILAVNNQDLTSAMQEQAATILKVCVSYIKSNLQRSRNMEYVLHYLHYTIRTVLLEFSSIYD